MKIAIVLIGMLAGQSASANESIVWQIAGQAVRLPLSLFRSEADHARILTRKDQIIRRHTGDVGMSVKQFMSPVRSQGARGTCTAFATIGLLERITGEDYSEQCLARFSSNEDPGKVEQRLDYVREHGVYYEADCPYDRSQRDKIPDLKDARRRDFKDEFEVYPFHEDDPIAFLKSRLAVATPVAVEFFVVGEKQWSEGPFIYIPDVQTMALECGFLKSCAGHAVVVTGLNDTLGIIEFKNSWNSGWGKGGYGYMSYDYFLTFGKGVMVSY